MEWVAFGSGMICALVLGYELGAVRRSSTTATPLHGETITRTQLEAELQRFQVVMDDWEEKLHHTYARLQRRLPPPPGKPQDELQQPAEASSIPPNARAREKVRSLRLASQPLLPSERASLASTE